MTSATPAACPARMQRVCGAEDPVVTRPLFDHVERSIFTWGLNQSVDDTSKSIVEWWEIALRVARYTMQLDVQTIDAMDFTVYYSKGMVSPLLMLHDLADALGWAADDSDGPFAHVVHRWIRKSVLPPGSEWSHSVVDGNPNGRGGSFRATLVSRAPASWLDVAVEDDRYNRQHWMPSALALQWDSFVAKVARGGVS